MKLLSRISVLALLLFGIYASSAWQTQRAGSSSAAISHKTLRYYYCPMHPEVRAQNPGNAPCCGMPLVPRYGESREHPPVPSVNPAEPGSVQISGEKQQLMGVKLVEAVTTPGNASLRVVGRAAADESRVFRIVPPIDGLVRQISPYATGDFVKKDALLATFLNREILRPEQAYIQALNQSESYKDQSSGSSQSLIQACLENMEYMGLGESPIREIARTRQTTSEAEVRAPASGLLMFRGAYPGTRFERGTELFRIVDVKKIWVFADLFENDARLIQAAKSAVVRYQDHVLPAQIAEAPPQFDPANRTIKIRLELDNSNRVLLPEMFVDVEFNLRLPPAVTIPTEALINSGRAKMVYVDAGNGHFTPRQVETGWQLGGRVEIVQGLRAGERIASSGSFLISSESRLEMARNED